MLPFPMEQGLRVGDRQGQDSSRIQELAATRAKNAPPECFTHETGGSEAAKSKRAFVSQAWTRNSSEAAAPRPWFPRTRARQELFSQGKGGTGTGRQARDEITRKAEPCLLVGKETDSSRQAGLEIRELSEEHPRKTEEGDGGEGSTRPAGALRCLEAGLEGRTRRGASRVAASSAPSSPCCRASLVGFADPLVALVSLLVASSSRGF